ncbi:MAG: tyrosine-type recombinase/integrase [Brevundimonas sp.]|jgi:integrase|uniref:tyrosine-type recombinase/integrase n=1 Tax=Brevundimonas sp. TaxID=1871086 RepID=UPI0030036357
MARRSKGARLYLRRGRPERGTGSVWVIRDGSKEISTGFGPDRREAAEQALSAYIDAKWSPETADRGTRDPADVLIADVIALYATEKAPRVADPVSCKGRLEALLAYWGESSLADIKRSSCTDYVSWRVQQPIKAYKNSSDAPRVSDQAARRELEDLSAAIGYWAEEHPLTRRPKVVLPAKAEGSRDALTRNEAARLLKAAMGWRFDPQTGRWRRLQESSRKNRAHLRRFLLIGLYTGTRPGVLPKLLWEESPTQAWVDLEAGIIYRRGRAERDHRTKRRPLVKMPGRLLAHMRRWRRLDVAAAKARGEPPPVTVLHHGGRALAGRIRTGFEGIVRDAGLAREVTPHWMRHTCATWLMEQDVPPWEAAGYTGMTIKTLEEFYGHHRPSHQARARRALG